MPTFEVHVPVGANQIWMRQQIREAVAEATRRGKLRPNSVDSITGKNSGDNLGPGTPIIHFDQWERDDDRDQADPQGRRLREHERAVRAAGRAAASRPRRSHARRREEVHSARGLERAGQGLQPGRRRRLRRRRSHVRLHAREGAAVPDARRRESGSAAGGARGVDHGDGEQPRHRHDGLRRQGDAHRLQDRRAQSSAGELLRVRRLRLLGVPSSRRRARRVDRRDRRSGSIAIRRIPIIPMLDQAGFARTGTRSRAAARRSPTSDVRALKVGDVVHDLGPDVHRPRRGALASDEARAAGRSARVGALSLRSGGREGRRGAGASPRPVRRRAFARSRIRARSSSATASAR